MMIEHKLAVQLKAKGRQKIGQTLFIAIFKKKNCYPFWRKKKINAINNF